MEPVKHNPNLVGWVEQAERIISPADVFTILKFWKDNELFEPERIGNISRDVARGLNDIIESRAGEGFEVLYFNYTNTSYEDHDEITKKYGDRVVLIDEMRDAGGRLKQYRVTLRKEEV